MVLPEIRDQLSILPFRVRVHVFKQFLFFVEFLARIQAGGLLSEFEYAALTPSFSSYESMKLAILVSISINSFLNWARLHIQFFCRM